MEDRIINGVNIENCKYNYNTSNGCGIREGGSGFNACEKAPDCYYKQLTRVQKQYDEVVEQNRNLQAELTPFRHSYFKGLDTNTIAELAKKSIRITAYNIEAEDLIECIYKTIGNAGEANALRIIKQAIEKYRGQNASR